VAITSPASVLLERPGRLASLALSGRALSMVAMQERKAAMTTADVIARPAVDTEPILDPLMDTHVYLAAGMQVRMDRCVGDVPVMEISTGRTHLVVSVGVGDVRGLGAEQVALAEEFATAARALADELAELVAAREQ
jgi:hypothetical protein